MMIDAERAARARLDDAMLIAVYLAGQEETPLSDFVWREIVDSLGRLVDKGLIEPAPGTGHRSTPREARPADGSARPEAQSTPPPKSE
jgi:hypothetical protein